MFVELIELLRCPRDHEESQLIAAATRTEARHVVEGTLGCPVCGAEFPIQDGIAQFGTPAPPASSEPASAEVAMRLAAFLDLSSPAGVAALCGAWANHVDQIRRLSDIPLVLVNPPPGAGAHVAAAVLRTADAFPLAAGSIRAAALSGDTPASLASSIVRAVRPGGRLVGPVSLEVPDGVTEMVRDEREWVGERASDASPAGLVALQRKRPPG